MTVRRLIGVLLALALVAAACTGDDDDTEATDDGTETTEAQADTDTEPDDDAAEDLGTARLQGLNGGTGAVMLRIMEDQELDAEHGFEGDFQYVAAPAALQNFLGGESDVSFDVGPPDLAVLANEGEDVVAMGPAITNPVRVIVREDSEHQSIQDLVGADFGQYGDDSTGSLTLSFLLDENHGIDFFEDFELVTQAPPALLPLLEQREVDAVLEFQPHLANADATIGTRVVYDPAEEWREATGGQLWSTLQGARRGWIEENPDLARAVHQAWCDAADYFNENVEEVATDPEYAELLGLGGDEATELFIEQVESDMPFMGCEWTDETVASLTAFLEGIAGQGVLFTEFPDNLFQSVDEVLENA